MSLMSPVRLRSRRRAKQLLKKSQHFPPEKKAKITLRFQVSFLKRIKKAALWEGLSTSAYIVQTLVRGIMNNYPVPEGGWPASFQKYAVQWIPAVSLPNPTRQNRLQGT